MTALRTSFTTTMRVIDRVHCDTTDTGTNSQPARTSSLTDLLVLVFEIAHLTDGGHAFLVDLAQLTAGQTKQDVTAFLCHDLGE